MEDQENTDKIPPSGENGFVRPLTQDEAEKIFKWLDIQGKGFAWAMDLDEISRLALVLGDVGMHLRMRVNKPPITEGGPLVKVSDFRESIKKQFVIGTTMERFNTVDLIDPDHLQKFPTHLYSLNVLCVQGPIAISGIKQEVAIYLRRLIWQWLNTDII